MLYRMIFARALPRTLARVALWLLGAAVLAAVFVLYLQPHFAVAVVDRIWGCF